MTARLGNYMQDRGLESEIKFGSETPTPDGFDPAGNAWTVTLRFQGRELVVPFFTGSALGEPTGDDVVECLLSYTRIADEHDDYWSFCEEFGETPSRKGALSFERMKAQSEAFKILLGGDLAPWYAKADA